MKVVDMQKDIRGILQKLLLPYTSRLEPNSLRYWQGHSFYIVALIGLAIGTLLLIPGLIQLFFMKKIAALGVYFALYALCFLVIFYKRSSVQFKTRFIALIFMAYGLISIYIAGPTGSYGLYFTVSVILCSLYIGLGSAILVAVINLAGGLVFGFLHANGIITWSFMTVFEFSSWLVQGIDIFLVDLLLSVASTVLLQGVGNSIKALNEAEGKLRASLAEKETLIRELYHRTKNNMQVVSSIIKLESRELEDERAKAVFKDVIQMIVAMSLVHQKLYESQDLSNIRAAEYVKELVSLLAKGYSLPKDRIELVFDIEDLSLLIDTAVPLGLVISEIVMNSAKHAFPGERRGRISIALKRAGEGLELRASDDGIGLPEGFNPSVQGKLGMRTLYTMVRHQLQGDIKLGPGPGVSYEIAIKAKLRNERLGVDG
jgi:two-component sensor histidine kinase